MPSKKALLAVVAALEAHHEALCWIQTLHHDPAILHKTQTRNAAARLAVEAIKQPSKKQSHGSPKF